MGMSALRRRIANALSTPSPSPSRESTPDPSEEVKVVSTKKLENLKKQRHTKRRSGVIFGLGSLLGLVLALLFAQSQDVIKFDGRYPCRHCERCEGLVQSRTGCGQLRLLCCGSAPTVARHIGGSSRDHGSWGHFH